MVRTYTSEVRAERAQAKRRAVVAAAHVMFVQEGWVPTTMAKVADVAGVTRQTVYAQFESKLALLDACIDIALSDGQAVPVREMPEYQAMGIGDRHTRIAAGARWLCGAHERSAVIQAVLDQAAVTDSAAASRLAERERTRHDEVRFALSLILGSPPETRIVDAVWTMASRRVWLMLVHEQGWSGDLWCRWFTAQVALVVDPHGPLAR
jgi:AcrR family transcriptional regulator